MRGVALTGRATVCCAAERLRRLWARQLQSRKVGTWAPSRPAFDHLGTFLSWKQKPCCPESVVGKKTQGPASDRCGRSAIRKPRPKEALLHSSARDLTCEPSEFDPRTESNRELISHSGTASAAVWTQLLSEAVSTSDVYRRVSSDELRGPTTGSRARIARRGLQPVGCRVSDAVLC